MSLSSCQHDHTCIVCMRTNRGRGHLVGVGHVRCWTAGEWSRGGCPGTNTVLQAHPYDRSGFGVAASLKDAAGDLIPSHFQLHVTPTHSLPTAPRSPLRPLLLSVEHVGGHGPGAVQPNRWQGPGLHLRGRIGYVGCSQPISARSSGGQRAKGKVRLG